MNLIKEVNGKQTGEEAKSGKASLRSEQKIRRRLSQRSSGGAPR